MGGSWTQTRNRYWAKYGLHNPSSANLLLAFAELERERNLFLSKLRRYEKKRIRQKAQGIRQPRILDTFWMLVRNDEWVVEVGHYIIKKRIRLGRDKLTELERAIYCFWVIDYSMRNAGCLLEALEIYPQSVDDLLDYAQTHQLEQIQFLFSQADSYEFEPTYYERFDSCCNELRKLFDN